METISSLPVVAVVPVYNGARTLLTLYARLRAALEPYAPYRIILVDDYSRDESRMLIDRLTEEHTDTTGIFLPENRGQQHALWCGLKDAVPCRFFITLDDDLYHSPEEIPRMLAVLAQGAELVYMLPKEQAPRSMLRRLGSSVRDSIFHLFLGLPTPLKAGAYRAMTGELAQRTLATLHEPSYLSAASMAYRPKVANLFYIPEVSPPSRYGIGMMLGQCGALLTYTPFGKRINRIKKYLCQRKVPE